MVTIVAGANKNSLEGLEGKTVGAIRAAFSGVYNIPSDAAATLNGQAAADGDVLRDGDELVFARETAQKG